MSEFWYITICDGFDEIDHLFIDVKEDINTVIEYMLWITYTEKRWLFAVDVKKDEDCVIDYTQGDENEVNIYCCNLIPDITIKKITSLLLNMRIGANTLKVSTRGEIPTS